MTTFVFDAKIKTKLCTSHWVSNNNRNVITHEDLLKYHSLLLIWYLHVISNL